MRERGRYQIQFMKTRSSSGVGQKVDLEFDINSLRIRDLGDEAEVQSPGNFNPTNSVNRVNDDDSNEDQPKVRATVQSNKLQDMLKGLKTG